MGVILTTYKSWDDLPAFFVVLRIFVVVVVVVVVEDMM